VIAGRIGVLAALTTVAVLRPLPAQPTRLTLGQWVRVVSSPDSAIHEGRLILVVADSVVLEHERRQEWLKLGSGDRLDMRTRVRSFTLA